MEHSDGLQNVSTRQHHANRFLWLKTITEKTLGNIALIIEYIPRSSFYTMDNIHPALHDRQYRHVPMSLKGSNSSSFLTALS